jgi:hypothetical protein
MGPTRGCTSVFFLNISTCHASVYSNTANGILGCPSPVQFHGDLRLKSRSPVNNVTWSVVAEWLGRRTLNQRVVGSKARRGICEQDTLKSTARRIQNKQNCLRHVPLMTSVKKNNAKALPYMYMIFSSTFQSESCS